MTNADLLTYYQNRLIVQYKNLPKAQQTIACLSNRATCDGLFLSLANCFNLNTATGNQLTILGKIVGVPRNIYGLDLVHTFFNFTNYSGVPASNGFNNWTTVTDADLIANWQSNAIYTTTDFEMLTLIRLRIMYNNYYPSLGKIKNALYSTFNGSIDVVDNLNTTITYNFKQPYYNVSAVCNFLGNILPKPMGVGITINNV